MTPLLLTLVLILALLGAGGLSGAAAALFTANRFRLRHRARSGSTAARAVDLLLADPARLAVSLALLQTIARIICVVTTLALGAALGGAPGELLGLVLLMVGMTLVAEMYPRAAALQRPERWARRGAPLLLVLHQLLLPLTRLLMLAQRAVLGGVTRAATREHRARARAVAAEDGPLLPAEARRRVDDQLAAEHATVGDVMVPRNEIEGLDLDADWSELVTRLRDAPHRVLPVWHGSVDAVEGLLDLRSLVPELLDGGLDLAGLRRHLTPPYYAPGSTSLSAQLVEFQRTHASLALVVDEYGEVQGLVTRADLVIELARALAPTGRSAHADARPEPDGSWLVAGHAGVRSLNRALGWDLPAGGPRTLNGLVLEELESIPTPGTSLRIGAYLLEVMQMRGGSVRLVRITPPLTVPDLDSDPRI